MPSKNIIKEYVEGGYYHIYNRGVEKRKIFIDEQDYRVFLNYLKSYLSPSPKLEQLHRVFTVQDSAFKGLQGAFA